MMYDNEYYDFLKEKIDIVKRQDVFTLFDLLEEAQ